MNTPIRLRLLALSSLAFVGCSAPAVVPVAVSLLGVPLHTVAPDGLAADWMQAETDAAHLGWQCDPSEMRAVWMGRRLAYMGRFQEAISWWAGAVGTYPDSYRLRRHMGHRLLTLRQVDAAVVVLEEAQGLAAGGLNRLEPDGAPGPSWEPRSTTHGNIWYHLALGYYLQGKFGDAARLWEACAFQWARTDDERVAAVHWAFVSRVREGDLKAAEAALKALPTVPDVLENHAYADLVRLYRGQVELGELMKNAGENAALDYGLALWMLTHGDPQAGQALLEDLAGRANWTSFGVLAAESDLAAEVAGNGR